MSLFRDYDWYPITRSEDPTQVEWDMVTGMVRVEYESGYLTEYHGSSKGAREAGLGLLIRKKEKKNVS